MQASRRLACFVAAVAFLLVSMSPALAVPLTGATTTYDQGGSYTVGRSIDGNVTSGGWGVYNGQTTPQTAVYQTTAPLTASELTFAIAQNYGSDHVVNQFRISATTDPNPTVTSGATWTELTPESHNAGRNMLQDMGSNMLRRTGIADRSTYTVTAAPGLTGITGFQVETFVANGSRIGGASNGNFVLSEFMVDDGSNLALGRPVTSSAPTWGGWTPLNLTDGRHNTFVHGAAGNATTYAFMVDLGQPVAADQISVVNRGDGCCPDRLSNYRISLHNDAGGAIGGQVWSADVRTDNSNSGVGGIDTVTAAADPTGQAIGQWVKIEKIDDGATNYWLQAAEIEVEGSYLNNIALRAPVQTSAATYGGQPAPRIVDGDLNTISHPASNSPAEFTYDINLGGDVDLNSIYVHNRNNCCPERLTDYTVSLHADDRGQPGAVLWSGAVRDDGTNSGLGGVDTVTAATGTGDFGGQWLRITGPTGVAYAPQIAEIEAYSTQDSPWIGLGNATADKSQSGWSVHNALTNNSAGWAAIAPGDTSATPQTAVFETAEDVGFAGGTTLTVNLNHDSQYGQHAVQTFRLAVTTADRGDFADGLDNGGDLGDPAIWTELVPLSVTTSGGSSVTINPDNTITLGGTNPAHDSYTVTANTALTGITGMRLETLGTPPGRYPSNGNYVMTYIAAAENPLGAQAVNIAQAAGVTVAGGSSYNSPLLINDGVVTDTQAASAFTTYRVPTPPQGMGYDLGGVAEVDTVRIYQHSAAGGGGIRRRLETVTVHTSAGPITFSDLPQQDVIDLDLGGLSTTYLFIEPVAQHPGSDLRLGIREIEVLTTGLGIQARPNLALGATATLGGSGWNANSGNPGLMTDGVLSWGPDLGNYSTAVFNNQIPAANWVQLDLGAPTSLNVLGIVQQTYGGAGARRMMEDILLEFSNDPAFGSLVGSSVVTLADGVVYQQVGFAGVTAQYVRIHPLSQYSTGSDGNIGIVEIQLFVPEPATLTLLGLGAVALVARRRRQRR